MGKLKKKNTSGTAKTYLNQQKVLDRLQVSSSDFRRLCILKGIYPHDPKYKAKLGDDGPQTYYHVKDIKHLTYEPLLGKFREFNAFSKKLKKLVGKKEWDIARRFEQNRPVYVLDRIVRERYPTFVDALRDLDDTLCHVFLFASISSSEGFNSETCRLNLRLAYEFQHYVMKTHALRKVFLSIKGIYYQATIHGQIITWLVPYEFNTVVPQNIDFRTMLTFLEFYTTLLGFVNYRLFSELGWGYPSSTDARLDDAGMGLLSLAIPSESSAISSQHTPGVLVDDKKISELQERLPEIIRTQHKAEESGELHLEDSKENDNDNEEEVSEIVGEEDPASVSVVLKEREEECRLASSLFSGCIFFISREVSKNAMMFAIGSFGGVCAWSQLSPTPYFDSDFFLAVDESDSRITHHVVDKSIQTKLFPNRAYVQPQWIFDSINQKKRVSEFLYSPTSELPPHLSPFVNDKKPEAEEQSDHEDETSTRKERESLSLALLTNRKRKLYESLQRKTKGKKVRKARPDAQKSVETGSIQ